jgi:hypothetical protein
MHLLLRVDSCLWPSGISIIPILLCVLPLPKTLKPPCSPTSDVSRGASSTVYTSRLKSARHRPPTCKSWESCPCSAGTFLAMCAVFSAERQHTHAFLSCAMRQHRAPFAHSHFRRYTAAAAAASRSTREWGGGRAEEADQPIRGYR